KGQDACRKRVRFCVDVVSKVSFDCVVGPDLSGVFWNPCPKCSHVPSKLRLALSRHFEFALAERQPRSLLASSLRNHHYGSVDAAVCWVFTSKSGERLAARGECEFRSFHRGNYCADLRVRGFASTPARCA